MRIRARLTTLAIPASPMGATTVEVPNDAKAVTQAR
jgi:hypothetical protein